MDPRMSTLHLPFFVCLPTVRQPVCLCLVCLLATFPSLTFGFIFPFRLPTCAHSIYNHHCPPIRAPLVFFVSSLPFLYSCAFASNYPPQLGSSAQCGGDNYVVYFTACVTEARLEGRTLGKARLVVGAHSQGNCVTKTKFLNLSTLADLLHICVVSIRYKRSPTFTSFLFFYLFVCRLHYNSSLISLFVGANSFASFLSFIVNLRVFILRARTAQRSTCPSSSFLLLGTPCM